MGLLHDTLPCSSQIFRIKRMNKKGFASGIDTTFKRSASQVKLIASPKFFSGLKGSSQNLLGKDPLTPSIKTKASGGFTNTIQKIPSNLSKNSSVYPDNE